jgi:putative tributyrin esterase
MTMRLRRWFFALIFGCVLVGVGSSSVLADSSVHVESFVSKALGMKRAYHVYLPEGYTQEGERRYDVVYALHGLGGTGGDFFKYAELKTVLDGLIAAQKVRPIIVVAPNGGNGYWTNHHRVKGKRAELWGDYVAKDLVEEVDSKYRTRAQREGRGLVGVSMGGFGAFSLTLMHPTIFHAGISLGGALFLEPPSHRRVYWKAWGNPPNIRHWKQRSPIELMRGLSLKSPTLPRLYIQCGTKDSLGFYAYAKEARKILKRRGIPHTFRPAYGKKHNWKAWAPESERWLMFLEEGWRAQ